MKEHQTKSKLLICIRKKMNSLGMCLKSQWVSLTRINIYFRYRFILLACGSFSRTIIQGLSNESSIDILNDIHYVQKLISQYKGQIGDMWLDSLVLLYSVTMTDDVMSIWRIVEGTRFEVWPCKDIHHFLKCNKHAKSMTVIWYYVLTCRIFWFGNKGAEVVLICCHF